MLAITSRHRSLTLLAAVLAIQVLLLAVQIRREQQVRLIRVWAVEGVSPVARAMAWAFGGLHNVWTGYIDLRHARQQNGQLQVELDHLKLRNAELESRAAEADRLAGLLGFRQHHSEVPMLGARVIGGSPDTGSRIVMLDRGSRDGIRRDMGVITPAGVVGKIIAVYPDTSQVLLLSDKDSGVGALLAGSRTQGPVRGSGDPTLTMEYVSNDVKIAPGENVLTSGQDRIFPKDLPVGTVVEVKPDRRSPFQRITVKPAAPLEGLEEVLVLLTRQELAVQKQTEPAASAIPANPPATRLAANPAEPATH